MKTQILSLALLSALMVLPIEVMAQEATVLSPDVEYHMPMVQLSLDIEYQQVVRQRGPFYQYAERYLGEKNIILQDETSYRMGAVTLNTKTMADPDRAYRFVPSAQTAMQFTLSDKGILCAIGEPVTAEKGPKCAKRPEGCKSHDCGQHCHAQQVLTYPGLMEEQMLASSIGKMAEGTAKQIYHIREARMNLLTGEAEHAPADGQSLKEMLSRLDREEAQLVALFVGTERTRTLHYSMPLSVEAVSNKVLFRFSSFEGPVAADQLSGAPYYLTTTISRPEATVSTEKKPLALSPFYYNIPATMQLRINDGEDTCLEKTIAVPQLGVSIPLSADVVRKSESIRFCPKTGQLIEIK